MKAERRHALQQNALAVKIVQLPNYGKIWLRRGLIVLAVVVIVTLIVLMRINDSVKHRTDSQEFLAQAIEDALMLRTRGPSSLSQPLDEQYFRTMEELYGTARTQLDQVETLSHDPALLSQALLVRGDINLCMATLPRPQSATTQPTIAMNTSPDEAYAEATASYKKVLEQYSNQHLNMLAARLGLATIAENHGDWKAARDQYQAVADDTTAPAVYLDQARMKLASLDKLAVPPMISERVVAPLINPSLVLPSSFNELPPTGSSPVSTTAPAASRPTTRPK